MSTRFRKRPVVIEAFQLKPTWGPAFSGWPEWAVAAYEAHAIV